MADSITKERINLLLPYSGLPVVLAAVLFTRFGQTDLFVVLWFMLVSVFGYVAATLDIRSKRIPNELVLAMAAAWVITITPKLLLDTAAGILLMKDSLFGFLVGGGLFLIVYMISRKGLGGGDVKFMAVTGLYLGFSGTLSAMLYGAILAALFGIILMAMKKIGRKDSMPLAPFLYVGILMIVLLT